MVQDSGFEAKGFSKGLNVVRKADEQEAVIEKWTAEKVYLLLPDSSRATASMSSFLTGQWKPQKSQEVPVPLHNWQRCLPNHSADWHLARMKAHAVLAIQQACESRYKDMKHLDVFVHKSRGVVAKKGFGIGELVLPPCSYKLDVRLKEEDKLLSSGICLGSCNLKMRGKSVAATMTLQSCLVVPADDHAAGFISPFWLMKTSSDEDECNMRMDRVFTAEDMMTSVEKLVVPMAKSTAEISKGDPLILFQPAKERKAVEELNIVSKAKKARKS